MKRIFLFNILLLLPVFAFSQDLTAFFKGTTDTIRTGSGMQIIDSVTVLIPRQPAFQDYTVRLIVVGNEFSVPSAKIFLPADNSVKVDNSADTISETFRFVTYRDKDNDRQITFRLQAFDKKNKPVSIKDDPSYKVYIKPYRPDTLNSDFNDGYEFWLFTGTNIDLLDGIKLKDLYFKGSYLVNFKRNNEVINQGRIERFNNRMTKHQRKISERQAVNQERKTKEKSLRKEIRPKNFSPNLLNENENTRSWMFLNFGKNRYFSELDTLSQVFFSDIIREPFPDTSITIVQGYYDVSTETMTENIFASIDYLYNMKEWSSDRSQLFVNGGIYFGLQTIKTAYSDFNLNSDTMEVANTDTVRRLRPLLKETRISQHNYNLSVGFTHILSTNSLNVKSHLTTGYNILTYPSVIFRSGETETILYENSRQLFLQLRIDATVLNPGISVGFEVFKRIHHPPLFNVSLTKVLDIRQLSALFGRVPTIDY